VVSGQWSVVSEGYSTSGALSKNRRTIQKSRL
jgi:hypothetical protein